MINSVDSDNEDNLENQFIADSERQKDLINIWQQGQNTDSEGNLPEEKKVVSVTKNYTDLERDVRLLADNNKLPEDKHQLMNERLFLIHGLKQFLDEVPDGKALFYIISSGAPSESCAIPGAIDSQLFDSFRKEVKNSKYCVTDAEMEEFNKGGRWEFPGRRFMISHDSPDRFHISLIKHDGTIGAGRFELGRLKLGQQLVFSSTAYFEDEKLAAVRSKYGTAEETGRKLSEAANKWIVSARPHLDKYRLLLKKIGEQNLGSEWKVAAEKDALEQIIFILRTGKTAYTKNRPIEAGGFMTNYEDALVTVRDYKWHTYGGESSVPKLQKLATQNDLPEIAESLDFFLKQEL